MVGAEFRALGKRIAKENKNVRVKFGTTNGKTVLHVYVPGSNSLGATISTYSEWEDHPANNYQKEDNHGEHSA